MRPPPHFWQQPSPSGLDSGQGPVGHVAAWNPDNRLYAQILGATGSSSSSGQPAYYWRQVLYSAGGVVGTDANGLACASSPIAGTQPTGYLYEIAGRDDVPEDAIVEIFQAGTTGDAGEEWFCIWATGTTWFTVRDDKSHTYTGIDDLKLMYSTLTDPAFLSAGQAVWTPDYASLTNPGVIRSDGSTQTIQEMYFSEDGADAAALVSAGFLDLVRGSGYSGADDGSHIKLWTEPFSDYDPSSWVDRCPGATIYVTKDEGDPNPDDTVTYDVAICTLNGNEASFQFSIAADGTVLFTLGTGAKFAIGSSVGVTGTGGGGDLVTGGIITTLGSGPAVIDGGTW